MGGNIGVSDGVNSWYVTAESKGKPSQLFRRPNTDGDILAIRTIHAKYLLETKWLKPKLIKLATGRIGRVDFPVITANLGGDSSENNVQYFVDPQTHLIRRVIFAGTWDFEEYRQIDGIMMPAKVVLANRKGSINYTPQFAFNVEFEPTLFKRRPAIEDGPDGWKPFKQTEGNTR